MFRPLANNSNYCYANSFFQVMFHIPEFRVFFETLPVDDHLKKFYQLYFNGESSTIKNTNSIYKNFTFVDQPHRQKDIESFIDDIVQVYPNFLEICGIKQNIQQGADVVEEILPFLQIKQNTDIQTEINTLININDYTHFPNILFIGIDRFMYNDEGNIELNRKQVKYNRYLRINDNNYITIIKLKQ